MSKTRTALVAVLALLAGVLVSASTGSVAADAVGPRLALPAPTGRYRVGTDTVHLVDRSRPDPWVPASGPRQLMVHLWYPTARPSATPARYVTATESRRILRGENVTGVPGDALSKVHIDATVDPVPVAGRHPLVVLSPGFSLPASSLTGLAEQLASRGYVAAAVDHNYESYATTLPDGSVTRCVACASDDPVKVEDGRVADVSYVLDRLTGPRPAWRWGDRIDGSRVAMVGHSIGGATASAAMVADPRIDAGVNLDGTPYVPVPDGGLDRPFLLFGTEDYHAPGSDPRWDAAWRHLTGWRRWFTVTGAVHFSFTDYAPLGDQLADEYGIPVEPSGLSGARAMDITRAYVLAFVAEHLTGRHERLLDGRSARFPEVEPQPQSR